MKKGISILIAVLIILLVWIGPSFVNLLTDWFWFSSLGFGNVFTKILSSKVILFLAGAIFAFLIVFINLKVASKASSDKSFSFKVKGQDGQTKEIQGGENKISLFVSLGMSLLVGLAVSSSWQTILKFFNSVSFGKVDPILGKDISYYIFSLPFWELALGVGLWTLLISFAGAGLIYLGKGLVSFFKNNNGRSVDSKKRKRYRIKSSARIHLSIILFLIFITLGFQVFVVRVPSFMTSTGGLFSGPGFVDIQARMPVFRILGYILFGLAGVSLLNIFKSKIKYLSFGIAGFLVILILGGSIYPFLLQKFVVSPNELVKESPYILNHIKATQEAFGLEKVKEKDLSGEDKLTMEDIENNQGTIKNIRLWDRKPLLDTFGQVQEIRTYYDFSTVDNDRYDLNGEYRQILLSPRELNSKNLPNPNFINKHLTFTHGFGLTLGPVNETTEEGLPLLFVKDIPPTSTKPRLNVKRPEIYYGEQSDNYVITNTDNEEFNYPAGEENVFANYEGEGGVQVKNIFRKFLYALKFGEMKVIFSSDIRSDSKFMYDRQIKKRAEKIFPFLKFDSDPYMIITKEGRLKWIMDAYTKSTRYPYSRKLSDGTSYMRNSIKVVLDAYNGNMDFYIANPDDPIVQTYANIFEGNFKSLEEMPEGLKLHIRYPGDFFRVQSSLYTIYHMEEPQIFYNKEDKWEVPRISENSNDPMMRHIVMKLPGEQKEEFVLMMPFTPQKKDNMAAWMAARSDGESYGELFVYRFPKQRLVFGPSQIINRISQNPEISQQISLWDQRGSAVNLGPLLVIPIEESLIYVRPLYLRAEGGNIPELKRVIVAYKKNIAMKETLGEAINAVFTGENLTDEVETPQTQQTSQQLINQAREYYQRALEAQQQGDWSSYGEYIKKLGQTLEEINK